MLPSGLDAQFGTPYPRSAGFDTDSNPVLEVMLLDHDEPTNYEEAMTCPDSTKWLEAMKSGMGSMYENKV